MEGLGQGDGQGHEALERGHLHGLRDCARPARGRADARRGNDPCRAGALAYRADERKGKQRSLYRHAYRFICQFGFL